MPRLWLDTETYSETPISAGTHQYVDAGKGAEIMLFAYAFDEEPVRVVDLAQGEELPSRVLEAFSDPSVILTAHNAAFDRTVIRRFCPEAGDPAPLAGHDDPRLLVLAPRESREPLRGPRPPRRQDEGQGRQASRAAILQAASGDPQTSQGRPPRLIRRTGSTS